MKKTYILALWAILLTACSGEQNSILPSQAVLSLNGSTSDMSVTRSSSDLPASTQSGVYALETGSNTVSLATTPYANALYTAVGSGGSFTSSSPLILAKGKSYQVCAYAPYQNPVNNPEALIFNHGTDVLYAPLVPVSISGAVASATLTYGHALSQIRFTLVSGHGSPILTGASLKVTGFCESCSFNLSDGSITPLVGNGATITDIDKAICFVPMTQTMSLNVLLTTSGGQQYKGTISRIFLSGYSYTYTLTVNNADLEITGQIINWTSIDGGSITVTGE